MTEPTTRKFQAEVTQVLSLVINSLYSNKEIFVRELVSNASDALDKLRFEALSAADLLGDDTSLKIRITADEEAGTLTIWDNGIGMTEDELIEHLGTVAHSGSRQFLEQMAERPKDINIIGQFGVGFYSGYLVADRVDVVSRKAGADEAHVWSSDGRESFTVEPAERDRRGTSVILHLKEDQAHFANAYQLRQLVGKYSDFVGYPIEMLAPSYEEDAEPEFEQVNEASALWQRSPSEVTDEQYDEFYKHLSGDWEPPLAQTHFTVEGTQLFTGLLYVPKRRPFDLFEPEARHGVRLYVRRVFIMENAEELVPKWLRFVRGVIDSDDLPLNVSRELLQDSRLVKTMQKQVTKKTLDLLQSLATDKPEAYAEFWENFGSVLKEGLHFDVGYADRLAKLVRFESSESESPVGFDEYVGRMKEGQEHIYYAIGASRMLLDGSPHLEALKRRGYEVLYLTDNVDSWAIKGIEKFDDKTLVDAMNAELDLETEEGEEEKAKASDELKPLTERFQTVLADFVKEVRVSTRLEDSPACLVVPEGGLAAHIERLLRAQQQETIPAQKRILELNPKHPLIEAIREISEQDGDAAREWISLIYDQALLAEGSPIADPPRFARRFTELMQTAVAAR